MKTRRWVVGVAILVLLSACEPKTGQHQSPPPKGTDNGHIAAPGTFCNKLGGVALPDAGSVKPASYNVPAKISTLKVNAQAFTISPNTGISVFRYLPICVKYQVESPAVMLLLGGLGQLNKIPTQASTPFLHPIKFYEGTPFVLTVTVTYTGGRTDAIGATIECWIDVDGQNGPVITRKITRNNYKDGKASAVCEHVEIAR